jgi:hypothetical protein
VDRSSFEASRRERAKQREVEGHLTPGDLAAYHAGRLTDERKGQIKDHLAVCEECALLYDSLIEFEQYRPEPDPSGEDPSAAAWLRFRERLREEEAAEEAPVQEETRTVVQPLQRRKVPVWQRPVVAWAVAAGLALCVVGLGIRSATPPEPPVERREPGARQIIYLDLDGGDTLRGGEGGEEAPELPDPTVEEVVYEMALPAPLADATYRAEIFAAQQDSQPIWGTDRKDSDEYLTIGVPRDFLSPGEYHFRVHKIEGNGSRTLVGTYSFNVP